MSAKELLNFFGKAYRLRAKLAIKLPNSAGSKV